MYMKLWGLEFSFQKPILLHYLSNRPQLCSFFDILLKHESKWLLSQRMTSTRGQTELMELKLEDRIKYRVSVYSRFPCGSAGKESTCNVGDLGSIPGLGRSPGEGNGYSILAWRILCTIQSMGSQRVGHH